MVLDVKQSAICQVDDVVRDVEVKGFFDVFDLLLNCGEAAAEECEHKICQLY